MDLNDVRSLVTLLSLALFLALMVWTWWPDRKGAHEAAAQLPFDEDDHPSPDEYIGRSPEGMRAGLGAARRSARENDGGVL